ncbi:PD-(D/E)XK motif protein [Variovorax robiniae]|uniref:PD-(D/E)XK motif protein n=1 Tax=Variovorax robiniae TaxID=1836199 RepID=A0ABU8XIY5_9BURK
MSIETLSWDVLAGHMHAGRPFALPLGGSRGAIIEFDPGAPRLTLCLATAPGTSAPASPFNEIAVNMRSRDGTPWFCAQVDNVELFSTFHQLASLATRLFEVPTATAADAFMQAVTSWRALLRNLPLLSDEAQLGLRGELAVLLSILASRGPCAVGAWTARHTQVPGRHDFRLGNIELEVKATRRRKRIHVIHGLEQLTPSPGNALFVVSLMYEQGGQSGGLSLADVVDAVRSHLPPATEERAEFEAKLTLAHYRDIDSAHYLEKLIPAASAHVIPVGTAFPAITREKLRVVLPPELLGRIGSLSYEVDLSELGAGAESDTYVDIFGDQPIN